jgi:hypothetical protein
MNRKSYADCMCSVPLALSINTITNHGTDVLEAM